MTFRPVATSFGVGFFLAALAIAGSPAAAQTAPLNPRVAIKVGAIGAVSDAGIFIAQEKGYFKDEGLDVELVSFKAAPQILPAIATGEVQVSGSAVTPALFNAFARGIGMKLVADKGQVAKGFGFAAIVIRSDLTDTVKDFKDLKGRKFAVMGKGVSSTAQLGKALELGGIEPSEVEFVELGLPEMVAALGNKAIDGATLLEPFITLATVRNVAVRWKGMEDFLPFTGQNGVIIYSQKFAEEQGEAAKRWMVAYLKGTRAYLDAVTSGADRDGVNAILAKHTAVKDLSLLGRIAPTGFDPNGRLEIKSLEADQDWFLKLGLQQGRADLSRVIDYQYLDYAVSRLGKRRAADADKLWRQHDFARRRWHAHRPDAAARARADRLARTDSGPRRLSRPADQAGGGACARRTGRHRRPPVCALFLRAARPERRDRKPHRGLERRGHRVGRAGAARRLYAALRLELELRGQSSGDEEPALRRAEGSETRGSGLVYAARARGARGAGREHARRAHRARQGAAGQAHLRVVGRRRRHPSRERAVQARGRHRYRPRSLSWRRTGGDGPAHRGRRHFHQ